MEDFRDISTSKLGGELEVKIAKFYYSVNRHKFANDIRKNDRLTIRIYIESSKDVESLIIGYFFRDKYGNVIFGDNNLSSSEEHLKIEMKSYVVEVKIKWPEVKPGDYFMTIGIGEGYDEMNQIVQCWANNIIHLCSIVENSIVHGYFNNKLEDLTVREID